MILLKGRDSLSECYQTMTSDRLSSNDTIIIIISWVIDKFIIWW